jgi:inosine-uridine nucleoside N-ribohydrolase
MLLLAASLAAFGSLTADVPPPVPVVISSDCGCEMDDQWAIAALVLAPRVDVRAILPAHAPGLTPERSKGVVADLLDHLPLKSRPPIIPGSPKPLAAIDKPERSAASDRLIAESKGFDSKRRLTVVMVGSSTDVASALLLDPTLADRIAIVSMAFDEWPNGGDPFNVKNDPLAWKSILESRVPLTVADGAVATRDLKLTKAQGHEKLGTSPAALYLAGILDNPKSAPAWPVWDCGASAVVLGLAEVEMHPRPHLRDDRTFDHSSPRGEIGWVRSVNAAQFWRDLAARLQPTSVRGETPLAPRASPR